MHVAFPKALEWSAAVPGVGTLEMTGRHLCFMGGRVKIASTGAEEAASGQGRHGRFGGVFGVLGTSGARGASGASGASGAVGVVGSVGPVP